jgi:hypothetical protein
VLSELAESAKENIREPSVRRGQIRALSERLAAAESDSGPEHSRLERRIAVKLTTLPLPLCL